MPIAVESAQRGFSHFAEMCRGTAPLYAALSARIVHEPWLLEMAAESEKGQPPPNLLLSAVHDLLLRDSHHELASYYRSLGGEGLPDDAWPAFAAFCQQHAQEIVQIVRTHRVQTNEVGRSGPLLAAMGTVYGMQHKPLHLIEIGASAGLNLLLDCYSYDYGRGRVLGEPSPVQIVTELRGRAWRGFPVKIPPIHDRIGVDLKPVDVQDDDAMRWLEALIWPDHVQRITLFRAAKQFARAHPPRVVQGDGLELLGGLVEAVADDVLPCVVHSHALYQMSSAWRDRFDAEVARCAQRRDLARISLEWIGDDAGPRLTCELWHGGKGQGGKATHRDLAVCGPHGTWMTPTEAE